MAALRLQLQPLRVHPKDGDLPPSYFEVIQESDLPPSYYTAMITSPKGEKQIEAGVPEEPGPVPPQLPHNSARSPSQIPSISQQVSIIPIPIQAIHESNRLHTQQSRSRRYATRHEIPMYHQQSQSKRTTKSCVLIFLLVGMVPLMIWILIVAFRIKLWLW